MNTSMNTSKLPIQVIRIEHPYDGQGFFNSCDKNEDLVRFKHSRYDYIRHRHNDVTTFPSYWHDEELMKQIDSTTLKEYKFAFNTMEQFNVAFTKEEVMECIELGFKVLLLTVDDYFSSSFQTVFKNPVTSEDITQLFTLKDL